MRSSLSVFKQLLLHIVVASASFLHRLEIFLIVLARQVVRFTEGHTIDTTSDRFVIELPQLHYKIRKELAMQRREYNSYSYFHGYAYQSLAILNIFGERGTEERFDAYGLADIVSREDRLLDIGCNCGFMAIYSAFRTGCSADGVDINPYMIRIGEHCTDFLRLKDRVSLIAQPFQDFKPAQPYSVVLSFATHWTDDRNYRVRLQDHFLRIHEIMTNEGLLVFESHAADVGNTEFYAALEEIRTHFFWEGSTVDGKGYS